MIAYPGTAPLLYSHGCLIALVLSLGILWETVLGGVLLSPSVISVCQEQDCPRQRLLTVWTFFIRPRTFFLLGVGLGLDTEWAEVAKFFGPTITPQNPAIRLLGQGGGF